MDRREFLQWVRATAAGWLLGFILVVAVALLWGAVGGNAQFMGGVGMGAGVGFLQARILRKRCQMSWSWLWVSIIGMGLPFLAWDIGALLGGGRFFSLPFCLFLGSIFVGVLQARLLRARYKGAYRWIPACVVGWGVPAAFLALGDSGLPPGALALPIAIVFGGVVLGIVTGQALAQMSGTDSPGPPPAPTS